jgi:phosphate-selective porin OprO/OprP
MHRHPLGHSHLLPVTVLAALIPLPVHGQTAATGSTARVSAEQQKPENFPRVEWADHPSLRLGRGTRVDFRARFQWDVRRSDALFGDNDDAETGALDVARRRVGIEGEILNVVDYQLEGELQSSESWRDAYANYKQFDVLQVQAGKFKLPFSLDENTSATNLDFVYRSRAAESLAPGRDVGVMLHGRLAGRRLRYEGGMFRHDGRNARIRDSERVYGGSTFGGRIVVLPFTRSKHLGRTLHIGVATTSGEVPEGFPALRARTAFDARYYRPDVFVSGNRTRVGIEAQWRPGPVSIKAEMIRLSQERLEQSVEDTALSPLVGRGWYVSGTWALTGERKASGLDNPRRPVLRGGPGAIELACRIESLRFASGSGGTDFSESPRADDILGNRDRAVTLGVNWYLNRWFKLQLNGIHETISDPSQGPLPQRPGFWSRVLRFQLTI